MRPEQATTRAAGRQADRGEGQAANAGAGREVGAEASCGVRE